MVTTTKLQKDAAKTAVVLRKNGWCQGRYHDGSGAHCIYGAMAHAMYPKKDEFEAVRLAESSLLGRELERRIDPKDEYVSLVYYNDSIISSPRPLLDVLDAIAEGN